MNNNRKGYNNALLNNDNYVVTSRLCTVFMCYLYHVYDQVYKDAIFIIWYIFIVLLHTYTTIITPLLLHYWTNTPSHCGVCYI